MSNEIIIRSAYGKVNQIYFIQPCPNPRTGRLPDCVRLVKGDPDKGPTEMILSEEDIRKMNSGEAHYIPADAVFEIVDGTRFDLDDIVDSAKWSAIEYCPWIAKDRFQKDADGNLIIDGNARKYGIADLYVERPGEITKMKVNKKEQVFKAMRYIYEDSEADRIKKCKVLGRNLTNAFPADILDYLIEIAEKNPKKIIDLYEGEDWKMNLFILDAIDRGVIRKSEGLYKYDDKLLGASLEATITLLRDIRFKKLLDSIKRETYPELQPKQEIEKMSSELLAGSPYENTTSDEDDGIKDSDKPKVTSGRKPNK